MPAVLRGADGALGFFEDLELGRRFDIGSTSIDLALAIAFANIYDPFSFHTDEERARDSMFNGIIVSGLQTLAALHALSIRGGFLDERSIVCGAGIDELKFRAPVRPGDILELAAEVIELRPPRRETGHGIVRLQYWVRNQNKHIVMSFIDNHIVRSRACDPGCARGLTP
jgi:acyl dehydratase